MSPALAQLHARLLARVALAVVAGHRAGVLTAVEQLPAGLATRPQLVEAPPGGGGRVTAVTGRGHHLKRRT
jgi:hypothetical protein